MTFKQIKFGIFAAAVSVLAAGCASREMSVGSAISAESESLAEIGAQWTEGDRRVEKGRDQIEEGRDMVREGRDLIDTGESNVSRGRQLRTDAEAEYQETFDKASAMLALIREAAGR